MRLLKVFGVFFGVAFSFALPIQGLAQDDSPSSGFDLEVTTSISVDKETFFFEVQNVETHPVFCERIKLQSVRAKTFAGNCGFDQETVDIAFRNVIMDPSSAFTRSQEGRAEDRFYCQIQQPLYTNCSNGCGPNHGLVGGNCHKYCRANGRNYALGSGYTVNHTICEITHYRCGENGEWKSTFVFAKPTGQQCP